MVDNMTENAKNSGLDFQLGKAILARTLTKHIVYCTLRRKHNLGDED
jgi:hypothetical protein